MNWLIDVPSSAWELAEPAGGWEHDQTDIDIAKDWKFVSFLDKAIPALGEGNLAVGVVFYSLDMEFNATHCDLEWV